MMTKAKAKRQAMIKQFYRNAVRSTGARLSGKKGQWLLSSQ